MSNMEVKKKYRKKLYLSSKELEAISYRMEFRSIIRRIVKCVIVVTGVPLLWYLCFIYYPLTTMVDIKGVVIEKKYHSVRGGRFSSFRSHTYVIKLDNYASSLSIRLQKHINLFKEISEGTEVIVQIQRKDLDKIKNLTGQIPLYEYSSSQLWDLPRMYGIRTNEKVIITSKRALLNFSTPFIPYAISTFAVFFALFFGFIFLSYDLKRLYYFFKDKKRIEK